MKQNVSVFQIVSNKFEHSIYGGPPPRVETFLYLGDPRVIHILSWIMCYFTEFCRSQQSCSVRNLQSENLFY